MNYNYNPTGEVHSGPILDAPEELQEQYANSVKSSYNNPGVYNPTGEVHSGSIYDASEEDIRIYAAQVARERAVEAELKKPLDAIKENFPANSEEFKRMFAQSGYKLDLTKELVESMRDRVIQLSSQNKDNLSPEASAEINKAVYEYLATIETLKEIGYTFGSNSNYEAPGFDPNRPDLKMNEISSIMHDRRKNGADISIPIPLKYDLDNPQPMIDSVTAAYNVYGDVTNRPYMDVVWKKAGYVDRTLEESAPGR